MVPRTNANANANASGGRTRRRFLRSGAAALATGLASSTTGCLSSLPPLGRKQSYGRVDAPSAADPTYRRWLPAPSTANAPHYTFVVANPAPVTGGEPEEFLARRGFAKNDVDYFGVGYANYDRLLDTPFGNVVEADFARDDVAETLTESGYDPDGSHRGFDLFSRSDVARTAAVRDGTIVWASEAEHDAPDVRALVDTAAGERRRYHEASDAFERFSDAVGTGRQLIAGPDFADPTDTAELGGDVFLFDDDAAYQVVTLLFPEGRVPSADRLKRAFREGYVLTGEADTFDVAVDGRLATLETRIPLGEARDLSPFVDPPHVTWGVSFDADAETLTFRHEAGEAVDADLLWFHAETDETAGLNPEPLWTGANRVGPGDSADVDLRDRSGVDRVSLVLATEDCCEFVIPFSYELE